MAKRVKREIWIKVGEFPAKYLETVRNQEVAELRVRVYEKADKQDVFEGYGFPHGLPKYEIR